VPVAALPTTHYHSHQGRPATERYFVEKYPIFVAAPPAGAPAVVSFGFVDEGLKTLSKFETFLSQYNLLWACLGQVRLVYIAAAETHFKRAERAFGRLLSQRAGTENGQVLDPDLRRLLEFFAARQEYETNRLEG